jgi:hypothetical protein
MPRPPVRPVAFLRGSFPPTHQGSRMITNQPPFLPNPTGINQSEFIRFSNQNMMVIPQNSPQTFKCLPHIQISKEQKTSLDNLWIGYGKGP